MTSLSRDQVISSIKDSLSRALEAKDYQAAQAELQDGLEKAARLEGSDRYNMELTLWMQYAIVSEHWDDLQTAVAYREKLVIARPENPETHMALSKLYRVLGNEEKARDNLRICAELAERTDDRIILAMLATQGHLPTEERARARMLERAIETYREALKEWTVESSPELYAGTQTKLGNLSRLQAEHLSGDARNERLKEAATAYHEALEIHTAEAFPEKNRVLLESLREIERLLAGE